jgi:hypothetical protein
MRSNSGVWLNPADDVAVIFTGLIHTLGAESRKWAHWLVDDWKLLLRIGLDHQ